MFPILEKTDIAPGIGRFVVEAPLVASKLEAGNFVIVRVNETGERIPLTAVEWDRQRGTLVLIVQSVGKTTRLMNLLQTGDAVADLAGPLGNSIEMRNYGTVVVVGGGVGTAEVLPIARELKRAGNTVIGIIGARTRELVLLENEMLAICDGVMVITDDGSYGGHGLVTDAMKALRASGTEMDIVFAIGPLPMMKALADTTRDWNLKVFASLNPVMIDGTGMCGGCRVQVGNETKFTCMEGPMFDAHQVDFEVLLLRSRAYREKELEALERLERELAQECKATPPPAG